jgi:hypothetical protein
MDINLYVAPHKLYYYRNYIKIQTVLANFGGTSDALFAIGRTIALYFATLQLNQKLMNKIFDFNIDRSKRRSQISRSLSRDMEKLHQILNINKNNKNNYVIKETPELEMNVGQMDKSEQVINISNKFNLLNTSSFVDKEMKGPSEIDLNNKDNVNNNSNVHENQGINYEGANSPEQEVIGIKPQKKSFTLNDIVSSVKKKNPHKKLKFLLSESLKKPFCKCCANPGLRNKYKLYDKASKTLKDYMDITSMVKQLEEFQRLKVILLNCEQLAMFQFVAKDECTLEDKVELRSEIAKLKAFVSDFEKMVQIILDYKEKLDSRGIPMSPLDKKLFELLDDDIKKMI